MLKKFNQSLSQKEKSLKLLYTIITEQGPISKNDLIAEIGLTQTTCSRLIEELIASKLIKEGGLGESSGGRKPHLYEIEENAYFLIGIDISRTYTKIVLMNLNLTILDEARLKMDKNSTPSVTIAFIVKKVQEIMENHHLEKEHILGVGVGAIGPLDRDGGMILNPVNFPSPDWIDVPIRSALNDELGLDITLDYGVNTALLAEYQHENFKKHKTIVYVIKGTGNRSSIIVDGHLIQGPDKLGMYGQGHMVVDVNGRKCICGGYGCVHTYSSIQAIRDDTIAQLKLGKDSILKQRFDDIEDIQFEDICQAVNDSDPLCSEIVRDAAYYTGIGLSNLISVLHPDLIILNGITYTKMDLFYEVVTETAAKRSRVIFPNHEIVFSRGNLGEHAIAIGAGRMALDCYLV